MHGVFLCFRFGWGFWRRRAIMTVRNCLQCHTLQSRCVCIRLKHSGTCKLTDKRLSSPAKWNFEQVLLPVNYVYLLIAFMKSLSESFDFSPLKGLGLHRDECGELFQFIVRTHGYLTVVMIVRVVVCHSTLIYTHFFAYFVMVLLNSVVRCS